MLRPRQLHHSTTGQRGQSLVELAILLPVFMVIVLGAIDMGRLYHSYVSVTNAARTGAQYASVSTANATDTAGIQNAAFEDASNLSPAPSVSSTTGTDASGNSYTRVTVSYTFSSLFDWPGLPDTIDLSRTVQMRVAP